MKVEGSDIKICEEWFKSVYDLQNSFWRLKDVQHMIALGMTSPKQDCCVKHKSHPKSILKMI
jgi:hypothetical protein